MTEGSKQQRGFAVMTPEAKQRIASLGGKAAHAKGVAHEFDTDEAKAAGSKGGLSVSQDREHMRRIGQKGGATRAANAAASRATDEGDARAAAASL